MHEKETEKGIGIADDRTVVIEVEDKESIEVVAETDHTEIEVKIVIVIKIVIGIGSIRYFLCILLTIDYFVNFNSLSITGEVRLIIMQQSLLGKERDNEGNENIC